MQHRGLLWKTCDTAFPMSLQDIELLPLPLGFLKSLRIQLMKPEAVIPSLLCALTEVIKVLAMSKSASASATCSLGFLTAMHCKPCHHSIKQHTAGTILLYTHLCSIIKGNSKPISVTNKYKYPAGASSPLAQ